MATSRIADSVGRVLGDRYRLTRPLGVGASAHVFVAEDVHLRRRVAIKLLHPALASDAAFLRRFQAEARVVAALRHPNILRVYDWGEDGGAPYLVMELLEGGSLRALLDRGHLLSPAQAATVGADAARALDYAHRRGLVHRDIKPANLIFDDEGRVTVADFGLARALAEASWTEPAGAVVGTARYAAPEQVRGESLDNRADVYSLALVLIEATTGVVPFAADTTIGTLMARVERPVRMPSDIGDLGSVLEAAGTVSPGERLDAAALARSLDRVAGKLVPPAPLPLAGPISTREAERDTSPTDYPGRPRLFDGAAFLEAEPEVADLRETRPEAERAARSDRFRTDPEPEVIAKSPRRRRRRWPLALLVLLLAAGGVAGALAATRVLTPSHPVPALVGEDQTSATRALAPLHFHLLVAGRAYDSHVKSGLILGQRPASGSLKEGSTVSVTLSLGPQPVPVPDVVGLLLNDARSVLARSGLRTGAVGHQSSMTVQAGYIISSRPSGGTIVPGSTVALVVSTGKPTVPVPSLSKAAGASFRAAKSALAAVGLVAVEQDQYSDSVAKGAVISTTPGPGAPLTVGSTVTVTVSKGPHLATVPSVQGMSVGAASLQLANDGFQVSGVTGNPINAVAGTTPAAGSVVHYGSAVQIVTG